MQPANRTCCTPRGWSRAFHQRADRTVLDGITRLNHGGDQPCDLGPTDIEQDESRRHEMVITYTEATTSQSCDRRADCLIALLVFRVTLLDRLFAPKLGDNGDLILALIEGPDELLPQRK